MSISREVIEKRKDVIVRVPERASSDCCLEHGVVSLEEGGGEGFCNLDILLSIAPSEWCSHILLEKSCQSGG